MIRRSTATAITSSDTLQEVMARLEPGDTVDVELVGPDGDPRTVAVTLGTRPLPVEDLP